MWDVKAFLLGVGEFKKDGFISTMWDVKRRKRTKV